MNSRHCDPTCARASATRTHLIQLQISAAPIIPLAAWAPLLAVRQNMLGIKARAEGVAPEAPASAYVELALWLAIFVAFVMAEVGLVVRRDWARPLLAASATVLVTIDQVLWKPPVWVDGLVAAAVYVGLWWMYRPSARERYQKPEREPG